MIKSSKELLASLEQLKSDSKETRAKLKEANKEQKRVEKSKDFSDALNLNTLLSLSDKRVTIHSRKAISHRLHTWKCEVSIEGKTYSILTMEDEAFILQEFKA